MTKFLRRVAAFFLLLFLLAALMDVIVSYGLRKTLDYRFQSWSDMLRGGMTHDVLILGNSRGFSHYDPQVIDSVCGVDSYNIGIGGYPINVQLLKWRLYKKNNTLPKIIIHNVDYGTLASMTIKSQHESEQVFNTVYDPMMRRELSQFGYNWFDLHVPMYRYFGYQTVIKYGFCEFFNLKHFRRPAYKGHYPEHGTWNPENLNKQTVIPCKMEREAMKLFEDYMLECHQEGIKVILVNSPIYVGATKKYDKRKELDAYYASIAKRYGTVYLNYTNDTICNDTANFCVAVHMNQAATKRWSAQLSEDLLRMGYIKKIKE